MSGRLPWSKFNWNDWDTDPALALCSMAAQGFWMRLLCICAKEDGYLRVGGEKPTDEDLAFVTRQPVEKVAEWLAELERRGVFSRARGGVIYSRRMVADLKLSAKNRANGARGGNPSLRKDETNPPSDNPHGDGPVKAEEEPEKEKKEEPPKPPAGAGQLLLVPEASEPDLAQQAFDLWNETAERCDLSKAEDLTDKRRKAIDARLRCGGLDRWRKALDAVEHSKFCRGLKPGASWRAGLDFVCSPSGFQKLVEATYDRDAQPPARVLPPTAVDPLDQHRRRVDHFKNGSGYWDTQAHGPQPGRPGCTVPASILAEFGFATPSNVVPITSDRSVA